MKLSSCFIPELFHCGFVEPRSFLQGLHYRIVMAIKGGHSTGQSKGLASPSHQIQKEAGAKPVHWSMLPYRNWGFRFANDLQ